MPTDTLPNTQPPTLSRRIAIKSIAGYALSTGVGATFDTWAQASQATPPTNAATLAAAWRAMSRVGYGPTPWLVQAVKQASSPRDWALQQVDAAFSASQQPPRIARELTDFNAPLSEIFEGAQAERLARAKLKESKAREPQDQAATAAARANQHMDFSADDKDPAFFSRRMVQQAAAWRLMACSHPDIENPLLARLTEFWFNHLNVYSGKGSVRPFTGHYVVNVARKHALGRFEDLLLASARHPAMLHYLDQFQSVTDGSRGANGQTRGLNENYARELMELHTLGVDGGYTQTDVRELARVLTGWTIGPRAADGFRFAPRLHDSGNKVVLGQRFPMGLGGQGEREGEDAIRMLARHPATAQRVCTRLAQFFVADHAQPALIKRLKDVFLSTQGDLRAVVRALLESTEFWAADNKLFKTPMDFACSALAAIHTTTDTVDTTLPERRPLALTWGFLAQAGQPLHGWQTPDGYRFDAATWLVPEALTRRADFALALARRTPTLDFFRPYLDAATLDTIDREKPALQAGLMLASPAFMYK